MSCKRWIGPRAEDESFDPVLPVGRSTGVVVELGIPTWGNATHLQNAPNELVGDHLGTLDLLT